jgi:hypothetical protein
LELIPPARAAALGTVLRGRAVRPLWGRAAPKPLPLATVAALVSMVAVTITLAVSSAHLERPGSVGVR